MLKLLSAIAELQTYIKTFKLKLTLFCWLALLASFGDVIVLELNVGLCWLWFCYLCISLCHPV